MKLEVSDLAFGYPGFPVGQDISLHLEAGEVLCLLGPNGCGKTTLFKTVMGLLPPRGGRIAVGGRAMESLARPELARLMAYVPQAHAPVFPYSVHEMVLMGRTAHRGLFAAPSKGDHEAALAALAQLEIADLANRDYTRLSGGQRQLVLIARALAQESPFILLDEPTASLDFGNQLMVLEQVRRLAADGKGIVMSTHDPDHAFACGTRALAMKDGRTLANGPVAETLTGEVLSSLYDVPVEILLAGERRICLPAL